MSTDATFTVAITASQNGPYIAKGPIIINDYDGTPVKVPAGAAVALCRCGKSKNKPFCDGGHVIAGFDGTLNPANRAR